MTLSNSRQQFLAYESQGNDEIRYGRRGGIFISTCVCVAYIFIAVLVAVIVGVIVYFITYFKYAQNNTDFWNDAEPFGLDFVPSADLRLPPHVVPSFYRLKIRADIANSSFSGDVYITIRSSKPVKEIFLHSKQLSINSNAKLTEQIYEKVETLHMLRNRREISEDRVHSETSNIEHVEQPTNLDYITTETPVITPGARNNNVSLPNDSQTKQPSTTTPELNQSESKVPPKTLHTQVTHSSIRNINIVSITEESGDRLVLKLDTELKPGVDYILEMQFSGNITNALTGFYKSSYVNSNQEIKNLSVTQFEPTSARSAFPCFDEPAFKSMFEISIAHTEDINVLSNMKVAAMENMIDQPGWKWTHFERSVNMSTYLVAYVLSDFTYIETNYLSKDNITKPIRVWAREELISKANYALTITPKLLSFYEDVFGVPYALDKIDLIAIPEFSNGAMENWGLITFRETALLYSSSTGAPREKQSVCVDVAHELAHQWFGNLVTMRWWTDLWLNEGFATYIEYMGVDHIEPEWNMLEVFSYNKMELLRVDALKNTSPVSKKVIDASEISQKFDEISYSKGASLIRMLNHTLTKDLFQKGLLIYLDKWKYANAEEDDLWQAMTQATTSDPLLKDLSVVEFMNTWTKQAGYPVVDVTRNYENGQITFEQKLFTVAKDPYQRMLDQLWQIPICYTAIDSSSQWSTKPSIWLKQKTITTNSNISSDLPLYVNIDSIGYYRVNYDIKNWELLSAALRSGKIKSPVTRAQLLDDAFNLAKTGQLDYSYALGLTTYIINGVDTKTVWEILLNNLGFIEFNLRSSAGYIYFQDYVQLLLKKQLETLNYGYNGAKDDNEAFLIDNLLYWECLVESHRCLVWARNEFEKWYNQTDINNNPIPNLYRPLVYNMALKHGGRREFDFLWNAFQTSTDPNDKSVIINSLPTTREESLIALLLERSLSEIPKHYAIAVWGVSSPVGSQVAQNFLLNNFYRVYEKFSQMDAFMLPSVLGGAFNDITTEDEMNKLKTLAMTYKDKMMPLSQTIQKLVDVGHLKINWLKQYSATITKWFKDYVTGLKGNNSLDIVVPNNTQLSSQESSTVSNNVPSEDSVLAQSNVTDKESPDVDDKMPSEVTNYSQSNMTSPAIENKVPSEEANHSQSSNMTTTDSPTIGDKVPNEVTNPSQSNMTITESPTVENKVPREDAIPSQSNMTNIRNNTIDELPSSYTNGTLINKDISINKTSQPVPEATTE